MLHIPPTNLLLLAAKQEQYKKQEQQQQQKTQSLNEKYLKNFWEEVQENGPAGSKKDMTERVIGLGRRTREEILEWNQMTAMGFQTRGKH